MMMYFLAYRGKPITLKRLYQKEHKTDSAAFHALSERELGMFIVGPRRKIVVDFYLYHMGFTWKERTIGIETLNVDSMAVR